MSRALITVRGSADRSRIAAMAAQVPYGTRVEFKQSKRSLPQNDRMWAMLTDISRQLPWHGKKLRPDDWKLIFLDGLKRDKLLVPNIDGDGFVNIGTSSSDLSKNEMSELIDLMAAFGANHGVEFGDDREQAA